MNTHHPSVCSCPSCETDECFVLRNTSCPCSGNNECSLPTANNVDDCCTQFSLESANRAASSKNNDLIKALNETISQNINKDVRKLLEEFRNSLIEIDQKVNKRISTPQNKVMKKPIHCYSHESYEKSVPEPPNTDGTIFNPPPDAVKCLINSKDTKMNNLIQSAKVMKLDGGIEYRHEHIDRVDSSKKYSERITKDEIISIKHYAVKKPSLPKEETIKPCSEASRTLNTRENVCCNEVEKHDEIIMIKQYTSKKPGLPREETINSCHDETCPLETGDNLCCNGVDDKDKQDLGVIIKPWSYMIIEDKGNEDPFNNKPSYYYLEQKDVSAKPVVKIVDECECPSDQEQLIVSTQLLNTSINTKEQFGKPCNPGCEDVSNPFDCCHNNPIQEVKDNRMCNDILGSLNQRPVVKQQTNNVIPYTAEQIIRSNVLTKPWRCMIIEEDPTTDKPSCYLLEQNDGSKNPDIKTVDQCECPSDQEQLVFTQQDNKAVKKQLSSEKKSPITKSTDINDCCNKWLLPQEDCVCLKQLENYLINLEQQKMRTRLGYKPCCLHELKVCPEFHSRNLLSENANYPCDSYSLDLKSQLYRCKCLIDKAQCYANHCCDENDKTCLLEKIRAQTDRAKRASLQGQAQYHARKCYDKDHTEESHKESLLGKGQYNARQCCDENHMKGSNKESLRRKAQYDASHCNESKNISLVDNKRAQADTVKNESIQQPKYLAHTLQLCDNCKKVVQENLSKGNTYCDAYSHKIQSQKPKMAVENLSPNCFTCVGDKIPNIQLCTDNSPTETRPIDILDETNHNPIFRERSTSTDSRQINKDTTNDTTSCDIDLPNMEKIPFDILEKFKEAYKACNCKICACVGSNRCDKPKSDTTRSQKPNKSKDTCNCGVCDCVKCKVYKRSSKTIRPNKLAVRGINKHQPQTIVSTNDTMFALTRNENSCTCVPCDCMNCVKLKTAANRCKCDPCECLQCNAQDTKLKGEKSCTCESCQCASCGMQPSPALGCTYDEDCVYEDKNGGEPPSENKYITFAALTNNQPHVLRNQKKINSCTCKQCECLACNSSFSGLQQRECEIRSNICKCLSCECEVCSSLDVKTLLNKCGCTACECITCEALAVQRISHSNIMSKLRVSERQKNMLECFGNNCNCETCVCEDFSDGHVNKMGKLRCSSKVNFLVSNNNEYALQSNTISQASTSIWSEDQSLYRTEETSPDRSTMPSNHIKRFVTDANDVPTKDVPDLCLSPEFDYIQELINYKTRSLKKNFEDKLLAPVRPRIFTPAFSATNEEEYNRKIANDHTKLINLASAKPIYSKKRLVNSEPDSNSNRTSKKSVRKTAGKSSLNLSDRSIENSSENLIKESNLGLKPENEIAGNNLKTCNVQYIRTNEILKKAKMFSLSLLKILDKYEKANQEFQSLASKNKYHNENENIQNKNTVGMNECLYNLSVLYQKNSGVKIRKQESNICDLSLIESFNNHGYVLDMKQTKTRSSLSFAPSMFKEQNESMFEVYFVCHEIVQDIINFSINSLPENLLNLSNVRTVLSLFSESTLSSGADGKLVRNMSCFRQQSSNINKNTLESELSRINVTKKSLEYNETALQPPIQSDYSASNRSIKDISQDEIEQEVNHINAQDSKSLRSESVKFEPSVEENNEMEVTVSISTDDMISLRSMESNHVFVVNTNRHPIRESPEVPSLHILKKNTQLNEPMYPKMAPAYPSMQFDIKSTLHSARRSTIGETGPSGSRQSGTWINKYEIAPKGLETTSKGYRPIIRSNQNSVHSHQESLKILEEESEIPPLTNSPLVLKKSSSERVHSDCNVPMSKRKSAEELKAHFHSVMRISNHTVIIRWNKPRSLDAVCGYDLLVDGNPVKTNLNPTTCIAMVTCIPQAEKIILTLRTIIKQTSDPQQCLTDFTEYYPKINS